MRVSVAAAVSHTKAVLVLWEVVTCTSDQFLHLELLMLLLLLLQQQRLLRLLVLWLLHVLLTVALCTHVRWRAVVAHLA